MSFSIGVLAGMGPRSTAPFIDMLVNACQSIYGAKDDMDFPKMHIISLPTPFYPGKVIDDVEMTSVLRAGITDLTRAEVSLIVVPCNLAHRYFGEMREAGGNVRMLHIADCAVRNIPPEASRVVVIGTAPTVEAGFYQERIAAASKEAVHSEKLQEHTTQLIKLIKERGFDDEEVRAGWRTVLLEAESLEAEAALIACTDISPLLEYGPQPFVMIDTAASLAEAAIREYISLQARTGGLPDPKSREALLLAEMTDMERDEAAAFDRA